jgi:hypothetical protein
MWRLIRSLVTGLAFAALPLWIAGCDNEEDVLRIDTPGGDIDVDRDRDDGDVDVEVDTD